MKSPRTVEEYMMESVDGDGTVEGSDRMEVERAGLFTWMSVRLNHTTHNTE